MCITDYSLYDPDSSGPGDDRDLDVIVDELQPQADDEQQRAKELRAQRGLAALIVAAAQTEPGIPIACPHCGSLLYVPAPELASAD